MRDTLAAAHTNHHLRYDDDTSKKTDNPQVYHLAILHYTLPKRVCILYAQNGAVGIIYTQHDSDTH